MELLPEAENNNERMSAIIEYQKRTKGRVKLHAPWKPVTSYEVI